MMGGASEGRTGYGWCRVELVMGEREGLMVDWVVERTKKA